MKTFASIVSFFLLTHGAAALAGVAAPKKHDFKPGQVWTFKEDAGDPAATLTILTVDTVEKIGEVVHISVAGITVAGHTTGVGHLPISRQALDQSVLKLVRTETAPPDLAGYERWKSSHGGVFTTSVSESLKFVRGLIQNQQPPK
jgi:hypothetical protein